MHIPADFTASIRPLLGDETGSFLAALAGDPPVSFRLNPFKAGRNPMEPAIPLQRVPWSRWGFYLEERPAFTFDPLLHAGYYYVQEASSMFVEHVLEGLMAGAARPVMCLDLCAAPGGKSLSLLSALPGGSLLVSNEPVPLRARVLSETMAKAGHPGVMVTNNVPRDFTAFPHLFDLVLVDAPCSGEGMFRKDVTAIQEWSPRNVKMCAARQRGILGDIWPALKPGGLLIYSTCTYNSVENEENALWAAGELGAEFVSVEIEEGWGISPSSDGRVEGYRFFPHKTRGEGLFVTLLRKTGTDDAASAWTGTRGKRKPLPPVVRSRSHYAGLLSHPDAFGFTEAGNRVVALPAEHSETLMALAGRLRVVSMGITAGESKGSDFIPSHMLAMSSELNPAAFPLHEVAYEAAVSYLRREAIVLPGAPKGYLVITCKGEPLGFMKNLGNRANNLYPNEWRIRSSHLPEKKPEIFVPSGYSSIAVKIP